MTYIWIPPKFVCYSAILRWHHVDGAVLLILWPRSRNLARNIDFVIWSVEKCSIFSILNIPQLIFLYYIITKKTITLHFAYVFTDRSKKIEIYENKNTFCSGVMCRSRWPRGLRLWSAGDCGFESQRGCMFLLSVVCCQVEVSATGWSLVQRNPTACGVSEYDREASIMGRPWPPWGLLGHGKESRILFKRTQHEGKKFFSV
jgi:hypothetical protein